VSAARRLARFVAGLTLDAIPEPVAGKAALLALDTLGNGLAAAGEDFGRAALDVAEQLGGRPESALLGRPSASPPPTPCSPTRRSRTASTSTIRARTRSSTPAASR